MDRSAYQEHFKQLVKLEQQEEMRQHKREMESLTGTERQDRGRCLLNMVSRETNSGYSDEVRVRYERTNAGRLGDHEFSTGNLVQVSTTDPLKESNPTATVWSCSRNSITLSFRSQPPDWILDKPVRIDLYVDSVTYQRMLDALFLLPGLERDQQQLLSVLLEGEPGQPDPLETVQPINDRLNQAQLEAVRRSLAAPEVHLIHGPPGTGKTVTLAEVIAQSAQNNQTILATAASNVAVDNLTEMLLGYDLDVVRVGHPARTTPGLRDQTLDARLETNETYIQSEEYRQEALDLIQEKRDLTTPTPKWRRGLSDGEILSHAEQNRGIRGISTERIQEMARYIEIDDRIDELFERSDQLEEQAMDELLNQADVVCTTNSTAGSDLLAGYKFDLLTVDEATQATEPSCLIPITKARKLVMAGDHQQLPPTVLSPDAARQGLEVSLFERLANKWDEFIKTTLSRQYRMHRDIMAFPSEQFYNNELEADSSVATHTLEDLADYSHTEAQSTAMAKALRPRPAVTWLDTRELDSQEVQREGSTSRTNPLEQQLLLSLLDEIRSHGLGPEQVGIITPYRDQARELRRRLDEPDLEVKTVDGFQGREKELIVLSFVRSNPEGDIGFLFNPRRLNVSLTRARRKLILLGDARTLTQHQLYEDLFGHVQQTGDLITLDENNLEA